MSEHLVLDDSGYPMLLGGLDLARTYTPPPSASGPRTVRPGTRSGNPWHDPRSGKFANSPPGVNVRGGGDILTNLLNVSKRHISMRAAAIHADGILAEPAQDGRVKITLYIGEKPVTSFLVVGQGTPPRQARIEDPKAGVVEDVNHVPSSIPPGVDPEEWGRRMDAVRDAAREIDFLENGDIAEFLQGRIKRPLTDDEIDSFREDVRRQRINDVVDWLDGVLRRQDIMKRRGRRMVKILVPRGYVQRTLAGLHDVELDAILNRLEGRGFDRNRVAENISSRFAGERKTILKSRFSVSEQAHS